MTIDRDSKYCISLFIVLGLIFLFIVSPKKPFQEDSLYIPSPV